jgi:hypothetical protein
MTDTITLSRADAEQIRAALASGKKLFAALDALRAALAEPEPVEYRCAGGDRMGFVCVLDGGNPDDCMYARRFGKNARERCGEWKPFIRKEDKP